MATISADPRFRLARALLTGQDGVDGGPAAAIDIFAALLEQSRTKDGDTSLNAALCQYEYGNALFRAVVRRMPLDDNDGNGECAGGGEVDGSKKEEEGDKKPASKVIDQRDIMAAAAMKRSAPSASDSKQPINKRPKMDPDTSVGKTTSPHEDLGNAKSKPAESDNPESDDDEDSADIDLALEMMDTSWEIFLSHTDKSDPAKKEEHHEWALTQIPRILVCMGDLYSFRGEHANAVDMYLRALTYREEAWDRLKQNAKNDSGDETKMLSVEDSQCQRHLVENYVLVAEALMACPKGEDIICYLDDEHESGVGNEDSAVASKKSQGRVLAKAKDRVSFAQSHYEMARDGMEEIICRYGKMAAANIDLGSEKKDIGYLAMLVVGIGNFIENEK